MTDSPSYKNVEMPVYVFVTLNSQASGTPAATPQSSTVLASAKPAMDAGGGVPRLPTFDAGPPPTEAQSTAMLPAQDDKMAARKVDDAIGSLTSTPSTLPPMASEEKNVSEKSRTAATPAPLAVSHPTSTSKLGLRWLSGRPLLALLLPLVLAIVVCGVVFAFRSISRETSCQAVFDGPARRSSQKPPGRF